MIFWVALLKRATQRYRSFAHYKKGNKERFALLLFAKRAITSKSLFCSFKKSNKEQIALLLFTKRVTKSKSLFRYLQKEQKSPKRANHSFALLFALFRTKRVIAQPWYFLVTTLADFFTSTFLRNAKLAFSLV